MTKLPRLVGFGADGKAICAGVSVEIDSRVVSREIIHLDSAGPEFIVQDVRGKTKEELRR